MSVCVWTCVHALVWQGNRNTLAWSPKADRKASPKPLACQTSQDQKPLAHQTSPKTMSQSDKSRPKTTCMSAKPKTTSPSGKTKKPPAYWQDQKPLAHQARLKNTSPPGKSKFCFLWWSPTLFNLLIIRNKRAASSTIQYYHHFNLVKTNSPCVYICKQNNYIRSLKILQSPSEFGVLRKRQNNPACTQSVSLQGAEVGHYTEEESSAE